MSRLKKNIINILERRDPAEFLQMSSSYRKIVSVLVSLSYDKKDKISWRAIEAIGILTKEIAKDDPDTVRNIAGRLLWMIRDESGGIGWSVPEILGEIVFNNPVLCADLAPIIVSFHEEKMLTAGVLWAIGRMGKINKEMAEYAVPVALSYLNNEDHALRGYAAMALAGLKAAEAADEIEKLKNDDGLLDIYRDGELHEKTVGEVAADALLKISH